LFVESIGMELSEDKIRYISEMAVRHLGSEANPDMIKKVVKEVIRRLMAEGLVTKEVVN